MIAYPPPQTTDTFAVKTLYTLEEFDEFRASPDRENKLLELIHGEIVEKMPSELHGVIALLIGAKLLSFVQAHNLGFVGVEVSHRPIIGQYNDRMPDVSFRAAGHPLVTQGSVPGMPDLAVEIKSSTNSYESLREKAQFYLQNGSRMVWLVYPLRREIEVCAPSNEVPGLMIVKRLKADETLAGGDVLPGFSARITDLFPPALEEPESTER